MRTKNINLIYYGYFEKSFLNEIANYVMLEYNLPVTVEENYIELAEFYDPSRKQYDGNGLLKTVCNQYASDTSKTIGLFRVDLFIPILTYIYGQAHLGGNCGIASIFRLKNELYGMKQNDALVLERFKKVIIHELGHSFGLKHCHSISCAMVSSTYVEDIDQKNAKLCNKCRLELCL